MGIGENLEKIERIAREASAVNKKWNDIAYSTNNAPEWLYFLAKHFGEKQEFDTHHGVVEVRKFFGVQYMIYK